MTPVIGRTYPLAEASAAHSDIEARRYTGKSLLLP
nr:zinc-binding dehydrogenase [Amycolatopsis keratiniphila]